MPADILDFVTVINKTNNMTARVLPTVAGDQYYKILVETLGEEQRKWIKK